MYFISIGLLTIDEKQSVFMLNSMHEQMHCNNVNQNFLSNAIHQGIHHLFLSWKPVGALV